VFLLLHLGGWLPNLSGDGDGDGRVTGEW
jgi:hypothetical protein